MNQSEQLAFDVLKKDNERLTNSLEQEESLKSKYHALVQDFREQTVELQEVQDRRRVTEAGRACADGYMTRVREEDRKEALIRGVSLENLSGIESA